MDEIRRCIICAIFESQRREDEKDKVSKALQQIQKDVRVCDIKRFFSVQKPSPEDDQKVRNRRKYYRKSIDFVPKTQKLLKRAFEFTSQNKYLSNSHKNIRILNVILKM